MIDNHGDTILAGKVRRRMEELAPPSLAESWDNVGWQVGHDEATISAVLVALDVDLAVVEEARELKAKLIVAHHPLLFRGVKCINPINYQGRILRLLLCEGIHVFAAHTNLDVVRNGVNGALATALGLTSLQPLQPMPGDASDWGFGALCESSGVTTGEMARRVQAALGTPVPRITRGSGASRHKRIALLGGSGASFIADALRASCSLYVTGEVKYHEAQDAAHAGLTLIEAGHYYSERPVLKHLVTWLEPLGIPIYESRHVTSPFEEDWKDLL